MRELLGQIPGADTAIQSAAREGWVAVLLVVIVLSTFVTFGIVIQRLLKEATERELRLGARIDELQAFIRTDLLQALRENTQAIIEMNGVIAKCKHE